MNSKAEILDIFFNQLTTKLKFDFSYKGIEIGNIIAKFYCSCFLDEKKFIESIEHDNIDILANVKAQDFFINRIEPIYILSNMVKDFLRYIKYIPIKNGFEYDYYFFISNPKFIKFFESISFDLDKKGKTFAYIFWDVKDAPKNFKSSIVLVKPSLPDITNKAYYYHHDFTNLVDRFINIAKNISGSTVIIPEGCLSSMHIVGNMGKVFKYKTICLQWGFFGRSTTKVGWRAMPYDKFLVWGDYFKMQFRKYNLLNIVSTYHPNLNLKAELKEKSYILFVVQKELGDHITFADVKSFLENAFRIIENMPKVKFVLRTHPDLPFDQLPVKPKDELNNLIIHDYSDYSLTESFSGAKMCIGISSTTVIESIALNCYPVYVMSNSLPLQIHDAFSEFSSMPHVLKFKVLENFIRSFDYSSVLQNLLNIKKELFSQNSVVNEIIKN